MYFVSSIEGNSKLKEGLPESCQLACSCAVSKLDDIFRQLQSREISIQDLQKIKTSLQQMKQLCEATEQKDDKSKKTVELTSYAVMHCAVNLRLEEFNEFEKQKCFLLQLCQKIHGGVKGENVYYIIVLSPKQHLVLPIGIRA